MVWLPLKTVVKTILWQVAHPWMARRSGYPGIGREFVLAAERSNILFIHVPKTGGTSINHMLYGAQQHAHPTWAQLAAAHPRLFRNSLKFAVIREPLQRFVSAYSFLAERGKNVVDAAFAVEHVTPFDNVNAFVTTLQDPSWRKKVMSWWHFRTQHEFVCDRHGVCRVNHLVDRIQHLMPDPPPLKWSDSKYGFRPEEDLGWQGRYTSRKRLLRSYVRWMS